MASTEDHCLLDLLWRNRRGELDMSVVMVVANHPLIEVLSDIVRGGAGSFTPRSLARRYGATPMNARRKEWWMLISGQPTSARKWGVKICMYRASNTRSTFPRNNSS